LDIEARLRQQTGAILALAKTLHKGVGLRDGGNIAALTGLAPNLDAALFELGDKLRGRC